MIHFFLQLRFLPNTDIISNHDITNAAVVCIPHLAEVNHLLLVRLQPNLHAGTHKLNSIIFPAKIIIEFINKGSWFFKVQKVDKCVGFFYTSLCFLANSLKLYLLLTPCVSPRSPDEATELAGVLALAAVRRVSAVTTR